MVGVRAVGTNQWLWVSRRKPGTTKSVVQNTPSTTQIAHTQSTAVAQNNRMKERILLLSPIWSEDRQLKIEYLNLVVFTATFYEYNLPVYYNSTSLSYIEKSKNQVLPILTQPPPIRISVNDSGFISVVYARTVYENFSFFQW